MEVMILRIQIWFRSLLESLNGGKARRAEEWTTYTVARTKNAVRVRAGEKSWETRRAREAKQRAEQALDRRENFEMYNDQESDAVDVA